MKSSGIKPGWPEDPTADSWAIEGFESLAKHATGFAKEGHEGSAPNFIPDAYYTHGEFLKKAELKPGDALAGPGQTFSLDLYVNKELYRYPYYFVGAPVDAAAAGVESLPNLVVAVENVLAVTATCWTAGPLTDDVLVQFSFGGVDVLTNPLAIPAGSAPRDWHTSVGSFDIAQFPPPTGDNICTPLTCRIVQGDSGGQALDLIALLVSRRAAVGD